MERFFDYFAPSRYDLNLHISQDKTDIDATAKIEGEANARELRAALASMAS